MSYDSDNNPQYRRRPKKSTWQTVHFQDSSPKPKRSPRERRLDLLNDLAVQLAHLRVADFRRVMEVAQELRSAMHPGENLDLNLRPVRRQHSPETPLANASRQDFQQWEDDDFHLSLR